MSDLLKESIADAKAVRETAIANAKTFLEENFAKSMKNMFAEKLKEDSEEQQDADDGEKIEEKLSTSKIGGEKGNVASKQHPVKPSASATKNSTPAGKQEFDATMEESMEITSEELDEILAELETPTTECGDDGCGAQMGDEPVVSDDDVPADEEFSLDDVPADEEFSLDELLAELEEDGVPGAAPAPVVPPVPAAGQIDPNTGLPVAPAAPAAPAAGQVPSPTEDCDISNEEMVEALIALNEENEVLKARLSEANEGLKYVKTVLEESNLLNAKLLYTNKLFKNKNLTEAQKLRVINTFDLTKTLREIKLAYTVLAESNNAGGSVAKKKSNATVTTITEGLASKPVSSTRPESMIVATQADAMASRFQLLAGITK
jgi:hypothetical protein